MAIYEVYAPIYDRRNPKCRACKYFGVDSEQSDVLEPCQNLESKIKNRDRYHSDKACRKFKLASWLK